MVSGFRYYREQMSLLIPHGRLYVHNDNLCGTAAVFAADGTDSALGFRSRSIVFGDIPVVGERLSIADGIISRHVTVRSYPYFDQDVTYIFAPEKLKRVFLELFRNFKPPVFRFDRNYGAGTEPFSAEPFVYLIQKIGASGA